MTTIPPLREIFDPPEEIVEAGLSGNLVLFVGAGVSMQLGLPSWTDLAQRTLIDLRDGGLVNFSELDQLKGLGDPKKQLSIASLIAEAAGVSLSIERHFVGHEEGDSIYKSLNDIGCSCVTTNYDNLLSPRFDAAVDGSTTSGPTIRIYETDNLLAKHLEKPGTVVHLHGTATNPESMIVTTKDYLEHYDNENVQEFLGELFAKKTVLFLGYGLDEAEILEHILRRGSAQSTGDRRRFALQGFFGSQRPLYESLHAYYEQSFGVHLLGFVRDHDNYNCLDRLMSDWSRKIVVKAPPLAAAADFMDEVLRGE